MSKPSNRTAAPVLVVVMVDNPERAASEVMLEAVRMEDQVVAVQVQEMRGAADKVEMGD
jgi:hypothetical protein